MDEPVTLEVRQDGRPIIRPVVYASTSEGLITDVMTYDATGRVVEWDALPVTVVQIDWDEVAQAEDPDDNYEIAYVRRVIADERIPQNIRDDIARDLEHARRFDDLDD